MKLPSPKSKRVKMKPIEGWSVIDRRGRIMRDYINHPMLFSEKVVAGIFKKKTDRIVRVRIEEV